MDPADSDAACRESMQQDAELVLSLGDFGHLFHAPPANPLSRSPSEVLGMSGVDYVLSLLQTNRRQQRARRLVIALPRQRASAAAADDAGRAIHRYVECRIEHERRELGNTYRYGWKVLGLALLLLSVCIGLAQLFASDVTQGMRPLTRTTFEYGFEIIGWVLLWHPIELLAFTPLAIHARIAALQRLDGMTVVTRADEQLSRVV
jgi:hypothetical protein